MAEKSAGAILASTIEKIRDLVDTSTIIGEAIYAEGGTTIIPVSKVFIGLATGGVDFFDKKGSSDKKNFGGGGGTGVTVSPVGFLVIEPSGRVELLNVNAEPKDLVTHIFDFVQGSPELVKKFKSLFSSKKEYEEE